MLTGEDWANWNAISVFIIDIPAVIVFINYRRKRKLDYLDPKATTKFIAVMFILIHIFPLWLTNMDLNSKLFITSLAICWLPVCYIGLKRYFRKVKEVNGIKDNV